MGTTIHPTAIIEKGAVLGDDVVIGPYAYVGSMVVVDKGTVIGHHATVVGRTRLGQYNQICPYAYVGGMTHDLKYTGGEPGLVVGDHNVVREFCTLHVATQAEHETIIGHHNVFLAYAHVAHDCHVGNGIIMSSQAALGGHVIVEDFANIGWSTGVHQFCRVGRYVMLGACSKVTQDVPPFMLADGNPAKVRSPNFVNLKRHQFTEEQLSDVKTLYKIFYMRHLTREQALASVKEANISEEIGSEFVHFVTESARGVA